MALADVSREDLELDDSGESAAEAAAAAAAAGGWLLQSAPLPCPARPPTHLRQACCRRTT